MRVWVLVEVWVGYTFLGDKIMAIGEWMVRKGAPSGTARVVGNFFLKAREENPDLTIKEFGEIRWGFRAQVGNYDPVKQLPKLAALTEDFTKTASSLTGLVRDVLSIEVGSDFDDIYWDEDGKTMILYNKVIGEELVKCGV
jgi:hypothetical protein